MRSEREALEISVVLASYIIIGPFILLSGSAPGNSTNDKSKSKINVECLLRNGQLCQAKMRMLAGIGHQSGAMQRTKRADASRDTLLERRVATHHGTACRYSKRCGRRNFRIHDACELRDGDLRYMMRAGVKIRDTQRRLNSGHGI